MDILFSSTGALHSRHTMALILVDFASRYVWTYPMSSKDDAPNKIREWALWMKSNGTPTTAYTTIRSDCDSVFTGSLMTSVLDDFGIKRELCAPYGHVPMVERYIRTMKERVRCMLYHNKVPISFWAEALKYATYIVNRSVCTSDLHRTRYERFFQRKPSVHKIRTFGCTVYARIYDEVRKTFDPLAFKGRFIGIDESREDHWKIFNMHSTTFTYSRSVLFDEYNIPDTRRSPFEEQAEQEGLRNLFPDVNAADIEAAVNPQPAHHHAPIIPPNDQDDEVDDLIANPVSGRTRSHNPPSLAQILKFRVFSAVERIIPSTIRQAQSSPDRAHWNKAIQAEVDSLAKNDTLIIEPLPPGQKESRTDV
jgi:hypothetical protein